MGKNISVYLDDETITWFDQLCGEWGLTRGKAIQMILKLSRQWVAYLTPFTKLGKPELHRDLVDLLDGVRGRNLRENQEK